MSSLPHPKPSSPAWFCVRQTSNPLERVGLPSPAFKSSSGHPQFSISPQLQDISILGNFVTATSLDAVQAGQIRDREDIKNMREAAGTVQEGK